MPDRPDAQIGLLNPKGGLGFAELNVGLPQLFVSPVVEGFGLPGAAEFQLGRAWGPRP